MLYLLNKKKLKMPTVISYNKFVHILLFVGIAITPLLNSLEVISLFTTSISDNINLNLTILTSIYLKSLKDVIFSLIFVMFSFFAAYGKNLKKFQIFFLYMVVFIMGGALLNSMFYYPLPILLSGVRFLFPLLVFVAIYREIDIVTMLNITNIIKYVFIFHLAMQIIEFFFSEDYYGVLWGGYALRNPGVFLIPSSGAIFSLCAYIFMYYFGRSNKLFLFSSVLLSVLLTTSVTGLGIFIFISLFQIFRYFRFSPFLSLLAVFIIVIVSSPAIFELIKHFGRGDDLIKISGGTRLNIFMDELKLDNYISNKFGSATNTGYLVGLAFGLKGTEIADSTYASMIMNLGYFALLLYIGFLCYLIYSGIRYKNDFLFLISVFIILISFSTIWLELYPINLLIIIALSHCFGYRPSAKDCMGIKSSYI
ncbi:Uncharacterised protein [Yersinia enterocolitica]|nr:Uncharacterised protein [Yersinia enterocolitica]